MVPHFNGPDMAVMSEKFNAAAAVDCPVLYPGMPCVECNIGSLQQGVYDVLVEDMNGNTWVAPNPVISAMVVTEVAPDGGSIGGGTMVTIHGEYRGVRWDTRGHVATGTESDGGGMRGGQVDNRQQRHW